MNSYRFGVANLDNKSLMLEKNLTLITIARMRIHNCNVSVCNKRKVIIVNFIQANIYRELLRIVFAFPYHSIITNVQRAVHRTIINIY